MDMELIASMQELCLPLLTPLSMHAGVFCEAGENCRIYIHIELHLMKQMRRGREGERHRRRMLDVSGTAQVARVSACIPSLPLLFINLFAALVQK